jgi:hypothetical protein
MCYIFCLKWFCIYFLWLHSDQNEYLLQLKRIYWIKSPADLSFMVTFAHNVRQCPISIHSGYSHGIYYIVCATCTIDCILWKQRGRSCMHVNVGTVTRHKTSLKQTSETIWITVYHECRLTSHIGVYDVTEITCAQQSCTILFVVIVCARVKVLRHKRLISSRLKMSASVHVFG